MKNDLSALKNTKSQDIKERKKHNSRHKDTKAQRKADDFRTNEPSFLRVFASLRLPLCRYLFASPLEAKRYSSGLVVIGMVLLLAGMALAQHSEPSTAPQAVIPQGSPLHPAIALLDADGANVLTSGQPVSTMTTCGTCHDTAFISAHGPHTDGATVGLDPVGPYTTQPNETTESIEMNCFLCHIAQPDNAARLEVLATGESAWASTATLKQTGIVTHINEAYTYQRGAFGEDGTVYADILKLQDPNTASCGQCHGIATAEPALPLTFAVCSASDWRTFTTGQVVSPQRISASGMNLSGKSELTRSWDVHAERVVACVDCHYAQNNPIYARDTSPDKPAHLDFDPRRLDFGEYLYQPLHELAHSDTQRGCDSCHNYTDTHTWLPYQERHSAVLACESCHIPQAYAPTAQVVDWAVPAVDGQPSADCRGVLESDGTIAGTLIEGYQPVLLPREYPDGTIKLAPYNLITVWYWASETGEAIPYDVVQAVWLEDNAYRGDIMTLFDMDDNLTLSAEELQLDTTGKLAYFVGELEKAGYRNATLKADVEAYALNHGVGRGDWATRDCLTCHNEDSRLAQTVALGPARADITPTFISTDGAQLNGAITAQDGRLQYVSQTQGPAKLLYVFGHNAAEWVDMLGILLFLGVSGGVFLHSLLRYLAARRRPRHNAHLERVYMYTLYERQWHWLQTAVIFALIFTGLVIHKPYYFSAFQFAFMVDVHNVLALILLINAALAAFYHIASGEIKQFLPQPSGFFGQAFAQALYYVRDIFKGDPHPFEKTSQHKLNPLQQITYLGILNVLLPAQVITGVLMWGAQRWPELSAALGGLPVLGPLHSMIAWLFATFIVMHVYLTTTGHEPLAGIRSMMLGWDEVEVADSHQVAGNS